MHVTVTNDLCGPTRSGRGAAGLPTRHAILFVGIKRVRQVLDHFLAESTLEASANATNSGSWPARRDRWDSRGTRPRPIDSNAAPSTYVHWDIGTLFYRRYIYRESSLFSIVHREKIEFRIRLLSILSKSCPSVPRHGRPWK